MKWIIENKILQNKMWVQGPREAKAVTVWSGVWGLLRSWGPPVSGPGVWVQNCLGQERWKQGAGEMALWVTRT